MKIVKVVCLLSVFSLQSLFAKDFTFKIDKIDMSIKANIMVALFSKADGEKFPGGEDKKATYSLIVAPSQFKSDGSVEVSIPMDKLKEDEYGIAVYFDKNANGILDKNMVGIPKEAYGFSSNTMIPNFEKSLLNVKKSEGLVIHLR